MKTERFELKLSKADKKLCKRAADVEGKSLGTFMLDAAVVSALLVVAAKK